MFTKKWFEENPHPRGMLGKKHSEETKRKISENNAKTNLGKKFSRETREKISKAHQGKKLSLETRQKIGDAHRGKKVSPETRQKMSEARKSYYKNNPEAIEQRRIARTGENNPIWNGGISKLHQKIRTCNEYKRWRKRVFERDDYTCWKCSKRGGHLQVDHYPISLAEILSNFEIRSMQQASKCKSLWDINNGRTLCVSCHRKTDNYARNYGGGKN